VYSELGRGTEFNIFLPAISKGEETKCLPIYSRAIRSGIRVLLVDDEEMIREITSQMLQDRGCQVVTYPDGQSAIDYYRSNHQAVDVVILDMIMPKMNGLETFRQMKTIDPCIRALLSSGYSLDDQAQELFKGGVIGYLQKPYRLAELLEQISKALNDNT
jgi:CheY-like chemotaxis protein